MVGIPASAGARSIDSVAPPANVAPGAHNCRSGSTGGRPRPRFLHGEQQIRYQGRIGTDPALLLHGQQESGQRRVGSRCCVLPVQMLHPWANVGRRSFQRRSKPGQESPSSSSSRPARLAVPPRPACLAAPSRLRRQRPLEGWHEPVIAPVADSGGGRHSHP
jgi:hypothetical protein